MKKGIWYLLSVWVIIGDQITKFIAQAHLTAYRPFPVASFLNLTLAYNTGAAFSFLSGAGEWHRWFFVGFSIVMSLVIVVWIALLKTKDKLQLLSLSLILGGALGNLIDRLMHGYVIDFIDFHYRNYHWAVFNLADTAISIGVFLLFVDLLFMRKKG